MHTVTPHASRPFLRTAALVLSGIGFLGFAACSKEEKKPAATAAGAYTTDEKQFSYIVGYEYGVRMHAGAGPYLDLEALQAGVAEGVAGTPAKVSEADSRKALEAVTQKIRAVAEERGKQQLAAGNEFLAKNKARKGVTTTASGLQYEVLKAGSGAKPKSTSTVVVSYHGTLTDGTVFDSSVERGQTAEFPVTGVIPGWTEALQLMPLGSKWKLYIPANLAYGPTARGKIPGNSTLIFDVELKEIK